MKIEINEKMKKLLLNLNLSNISHNIDNFNNIEQSVYNGIFEESYEENFSGDFINPNNLLSTKSDLNLGLKYYFRSDRIDDYFFKFPSNSELHFLTCFITLGIWLSNIKKIYPKDKFIFLIQYDEGSDGSDGFSEVSSGFFVKCYLKKDFTRIYGVKSINELDIAHICIEV